MMVKKNTKDMILHLKNFSEPEANEFKIDKNDLILLINSCVKRMKQEDTSTMLTK